jgi:hypothetical protein
MWRIWCITTLGSLDLWQRSGPRWRHHTRCWRPVQTLGLPMIRCSYSPCLVEIRLWRIGDLSSYKPPPNAYKSDRWIVYTFDTDLDFSLGFCGSQCSGFRVCGVGHSVIQMVYHNQSKNRSFIPRLSIQFLQRANGSWIIYMAFQLKFPSRYFPVQIYRI